MSFLIIGGTEKAGTTSVFEYLAMHPGVQASLRKETDYFRRGSCSEAGYGEQFPPGRAGRVRLEASPGYLGLAREVAPRIERTLKHCHLLFILRDPVDRFQSSYRFHRSKFYIPESLDIDRYVDMCLAFERGEIGLSDTPFSKRWFLDVLPAGRYGDHLAHYLERFGERVMLLDFDRLNREPGPAVQDICEALDIDPGFYRDFDFFRANSTFQSRLKAFHTLGMTVNDALEPVLRRYPRLKRRIVAGYRAVNGSGTVAGATLSEPARARLRDYYAADVRQVQSLFQSRNQPSLQWKSFHAA